MSWLSLLRRFAHTALQVWRQLPHGGAYLAGALLSYLVILVFTGAHDPEGGLPGVREMDMPANTPSAVYVYHYARPYLDVGLWLGAIGFVLYVLRTLPDLRRLVLPLMGLGTFVTARFFADEIHGRWFRGEFSLMGEPDVPATFYGKLVMIAILGVTPGLMLAWYVRRSSLERYTLRNFLQPLVFCFLAFFSLFILMDLISNLREYQDTRTPLSTILLFYAQLAPAVFVMIAPWGCLLAALFSLMRMSRFNEIISMLGAGRSLWQIAQPLLIVAAYVSLLAMALNYHWAPHAESQRKALTTEANNKTRTRSGTPTIANAVLHHNPETNRTWFLGKVPFDTLHERLSQVEIRQFDAKGQMEKSWIARSGRRWPSGMWVLNNGIETTFQDGVEIDCHRFDSDGDERFTDSLADGSRANSKELRGFPETPWSIISSQLLPDDLGVTELAAYLIANESLPKDKLSPFRTHLSDRFSRPWLAAFIVFAAIPLGIAYTRRGALGGMAGSLVLVAGLLFLPELCSSLGKGGHLSPRLAVWLPHLTLFLLGGTMFYYKSLNKELPRLTWKGLKAWSQRLKAKA
jgi:lipopolysaccharide export LptBFGC system permease protein LptF